MTISANLNPVYPIAGAANRLLPASFTEIELNDNLNPDAKMEISAMKITAEETAQPGYNLMGGLADIAPKIGFNVDVLV